MMIIALASLPLVLLQRRRPLEAGAVAAE